ncbi:mechanosensitive ion channel family protein [Microbaculum marinum]|uniref:Small-conductance mechanosensitive channel n=1 Tax=Microbaculum marinum TaxID=1764581 RepID=A0AAW9RQ30_9HYPH
MRQLAFATVLLLAAVLAAATGGGLSAARAQSDGPVAQPDREISAEKDPQADRALQSRLNALFDEVEGLSGVFALVRDGVVRLNGVVAEPALSRAAESLAARVEGVVLVENRIEMDTDIANRFEPLMKRMLKDLQDVVLFLPVFAVALVVVFLFWAVAQIVIRLSGPLLRRTPNEFVQNIVKTVIRVVIVGVGVLVALEAMDARELATSILGAAGLVGLAVGFAVKDTIENYLASILLSIRQPFSPHEVVNIDGQEGMVARLTSRTTVLINYDGNHVRIPNATVFKATIINYSREPKRRFDFRLGVDPGCDIDVARALVVETLRGFDAVLDDPGPMVTIDELGDWAVILWVAAWIDQRTTDLQKAKSESLRLIKIAFDDAGIAMPNPTYRILTGEEPASQAPSRQPRPARTAAGPAAADTSVERVMDEAVQRDRENAQSPDLLQTDAEKE